MENLEEKTISMEIRAVSKNYVSLYWDDATENFKNFNDKNPNPIMVSNKIEFDKKIEEILGFLIASKFKKKYLDYNNLIFNGKKFNKELYRYEEEYYVSFVFNDCVPKLIRHDIIHIIEDNNNNNNSKKSFKFKFKKLIDKFFKKRR